MEDRAADEPSPLSAYLAEAREAILAVLDAHANALEFTIECPHCGTELYVSAGDTHPLEPFSATHPSQENALPWPYLLPGSSGSENIFPPCESGP